MDDATFMYMPETQENVSCDTLNQDQGKRRRKAAVHLEYTETEQLQNKAYVPAVGSAVGERIEQLASMRIPRRAAFKDTHDT